MDPLSKSLSEGQAGYLAYYEIRDIQERDSEAQVIFHILSCGLIISITLTVILTIVVSSATEGYFARLRSLLHRYGTFAWS